MSEFWEVFKAALWLTIKVSVWAYINYYFFVLNRRALAKLLRGYGAYEIHKWRENYKAVFPWIGWKPETVRRLPGK